MAVSCHVELQTHGVTPTATWHGAAVPRSILDDVMNWWVTHRLQELQQYDMNEHIVALYAAWD